MLPRFSTRSDDTSGAATELAGCRARRFGGDALRLGVPPRALAFGRRGAGAVAIALLRVAAAEVVTRAHLRDEDACARRAREVRFREIEPIAGEQEGAERRVVGGEIGRIAAPRDEELFVDRPGRV